METDKINSKATEHSKHPVAETEQFLPFAKPCIEQEDIDGVVEVLRSGWITTGPKSAELENAVKNLIGAEYTVATSSATAALHLYLLAQSIGPGDEVIIPSMTWVSTVNVICLVGATPVFCDVDKQSLTTSRELIEPLINKNTRLIIVVHLGGAAIDTTDIYQLAEENHLLFIEDAAQALGTQYKDRPVGSTGTAFFSFQACKNITSAEGGMLVTDDARLANSVRRLRYHGIEATKPQVAQGRAAHAEVIEPGLKYNLPDLNASLALSQIERIQRIISKRTGLADTYRKLLASIHGIEPISFDQNVLHSWNLMIVRIDPSKAGINRDQFIEAMAKKNIGIGIHFHPAHLHAFYKKHFSSQATLPNTLWNSDRICSLPLFSDMTTHDVERVISASNEVFVSAGTGAHYV